MHVAHGLHHAFVHVRDMLKKRTRRRYLILRLALYCSSGDLISHSWYDTVHAESFPSNRKEIILSLKY